MKLFPTLLSLFSTLLFSCGNSARESQEEITVSKESTTQQSTSKNRNQPDGVVKAIPKSIKPIFGYRFVIGGDFNGDGKQEELIEHYFSALDNKETNKFYDGLSDYDQLVELAVNKSPYSFVLAGNNAIDTLHISAKNHLLGLSYLKNEGDLNGDGTDEVSYVVNWADWSSMNTWYLMTYRNNRWQELYSFPIWDWQIPDLPITFSQYGTFGLQNKTVSSVPDTMNARIESALGAFKGLVRKTKTNEIEVIFRNSDSEKDTMNVVLKKPK